MLRALLLIAAILPAQGIRVEFDDGKILESLGPVARVGNVSAWTRKLSENHVRFYLRNEGASYWDLRLGFSPTNAENVIVKGIALGVPNGWSVEWATERNARPIDITYQGLDVWIAYSRGDVCPVDPRDPREMQVTGGETISWDASKSPRSPPEVDAEKRASALRALGMTGEPSGFANIDYLRSLYTISPDSWVYGGNSGNGRNSADLGWWMINFHQRHTSSRWSRCADVIRWGSVPWVQGQSNAHYGSEEACLAHWLRTGDAGGFTLAEAILRNKRDAGFTWTSRGDPRQRHHWRYENTSVGAVDSGRNKLGTYRHCEYSHAWGSGMEILAFLTGDPDAFECAELWYTRLHGEAPAEIWNGRNGARFVVWALRDLRTRFILRGDQRCAVTAERLIRHAVGLCGTHWPGDPPVRYPWQEAMATELCLSWVDLGICEDLRSRLEDLGRSAIEAGLQIKGTYAQACMETGNPQRGPIWQSPPLTAFFLPLVRRLGPPELAEACRRTATELTFATWSGQAWPVDRGFASTQYGSATEKVFGDIAQWVTDEALR